MLTEYTIAGLHEHLFARLPAMAKDAGVLDIGCGSGAWLSRFAAAGYAPLAGIDMDPARMVAPGIRCVEAHLDRDPPRALGRFGLVSAIEVIEHIENPGKLLELAAANAEPGGHLLLTTPNIHSVLARLRFLLGGTLRGFDDRTDPTHISPIALRYLEKVLPRHGFRIVDAWGYPAHGTITTRPLVRLLYRAVEPLFPAIVPGDTLCVLAQRA